jgi:hypothetical protein
MLTLIFASSSTTVTLEAQVLAERQVEARERREVPRAVLVVERAEDAIRVLPDGELRRVLLHEHEERGDALAHRRLGGDEQARQVDGAPGEVLGLHAVARGGGGRELGAGVVLELGQHDDHDRDGAQHHDERDARFFLAAFRARRGSARGAHCWGIPKLRGCWMGRKTLVV